MAGRAEGLTPFRLARAALDRVVAHARAAQPAECCGLLVGSGREIAEAAPARNLAASATRFFLDPRDHMAARRSARDRGLEVIGFYHSHPHSPARPSPTDLDEAEYPGAVHLIVSLRDEPPELRLFRIEAGAAEEVPFEIAGSVSDPRRRGPAGS